MTTADLLTAALHRDWYDLQIETGMSPTRLTQLALQAIEDPEVIAAHPAACRQLRRRRDEARRIRGRY